MKKHAKILVPLGAAALSMGVFAFTKPVMAEDIVPIDHNTNHNTSADVTVRLTVVGEAPEVTIDSPLDEAEITGTKADVKVNYAKANQLRYQLIYIDKEGVQTPYDLPSKIVSDTGVSDGVDEFEIDIENFGGQYGNYILKVNADGAGSTEDSVAFTFKPMEIIPKDDDGDGTGDPTIVIPKVIGARRVRIQAYNENGDPILDPAIDKELTEEEEIDVTIPLESYGVPEGAYRIVVTYYDGDEEVIVVIERTIDYKPTPAPEVPDTGGFMGVLGLSKQDTISTGLALLFITAFFGALVIVKRNKSSKRR